MTPVDFVGAAAASIAFVLLVPQAVKTWQLRSNPEALAAVSISGQLLLLLNTCLWLIYALGSGAYWVGAPAVVNLPLTVTVITLLLAARRRRRAATDLCRA